MEVGVEKAKMAGDGFGRGTHVASNHAHAHLAVQQRLYGGTVGHA